MIGDTDRIGVVACTVKASSTRNAPLADTTVKIILGQPPCSGSEPMVRAPAPHLAGAFGQPLAVENRPGALIRPRRP